MQSPEYLEIYLIGVRFGVYRDTIPMMANHTKYPNWVSYKDLGAETVRVARQVG